MQPYSSSLLPPVQHQTPSVMLTFTPPQETIEKMIRAINAEAIKGIAEALINVVIEKLDMQFLKIQPEKTCLFSITYQNIDSSKLKEYLLLKLTSLMEVAFSTPSQFHEEGLTIPLIKTGFDEIGLLDLIYDEDTAKVINSKKARLNIKTMDIYLCAKFWKTEEGDLFEINHEIKTS